LKDQASADNFEKLKYNLI